MQNKISLKIIVAALCLGAIAQSAFAQWQWMDKDGRKVFSDRSPPAEIAEKDILKKPAGIARAAAAANIAASAPAVKASAPKLSGKDAELEAKKKKAEDDEAAKKKNRRRQNRQGQSRKL